jgi:hypothetical protein
MVPTIGIAEMYVQDNGIILPGREGTPSRGAHCSQINENEQQGQIP